MKKFVVFLLVVLSVALCFAFESVDYYFPDLSEEGLERVKSFETIAVYPSEIDNGFVCSAPYIANRIEYNRTVEDSWTVANVRFVPYSEKMLAMSEEERLIHVYNTMKAVSSIKGVTYNSSSKGDNAVLFEDAYMKSGPAKRDKRIDDPVTDKKPPYSSENYCLLKDANFGNNIYSLSYFTSDNEVFLDITNCTAMKYFGITCMPKECLSMCIDACLTEEGIIVTALANVTGRPQDIKVFSLSANLPGMFLNRINSLGSWFVSEI